MAPLLIATCILLTLATPLSNVLMCKGMLASRSTNGISVTAALLLALCAQAQLATMYYLWACPPFKRYGEAVPKPPRFMDYLNLAQLIVQWISSIFLLIVLLFVSTRAEIAETTSTKTSSGGSVSTKTAATLLTVHASLCIFWALVAGTPTKDWLDLTFVSIMSFNQWCINPIITITTILASILQAGTTKDVQGPSALNRTVVLLQATVFLALAVSWPFRFQVPLNLRTPYRDDWYLLAEWYPLVGWACVNNAVIAIGQGVVLYIASTKLDNGAASLGERQPLISTQ
ncbi:hypothetical protein F5X68DRAFT_25174 [Plectosphaerella plurivora]|uniref:Uncharacterized protein n=1 Tax=Plectosphaerella plurivora TaxID=936078 RepID=A0A9P9A8D5_9PEZI|nr:hypothetical protein F5X68DRAFT_25174 [Plectosphaerella plurivora]